MNVNLGCGTYPAEGWVNVDRRPFEGTDFVIRGTGLPWADESVENVYAGHVFEHLTYDAELPHMLAEIHRVLHPLGTLMVVGPDMDRAIESFPDHVSHIWPGLDLSDEPGARHQWISKVPEMSAALLAAGFDGEEIPITSVPNTWPVVSRIGWQFAIQARKART